MLPGLERLREYRRRLLLGLCRWLEGVEGRGRLTVIVFGSIVRGDYSLRSDIDVIIVSPLFRGVRFIERWKLLPRSELPLDLIPWTPEEARVMLSKPSWRKALERCMVVRDDLRLAPPHCARLDCSGGWES